MLKLSLKPRKQIKKHLDALRREGSIPGVLYGPTIQPTPVTVAESDFENVYAKAGESTLVSITGIGEEKEGVVLIRDPKRDVITRKVLHTDFYQLPLDKPIEVAVSVVATGESTAVSRMSGVLIKNIQEATIRALPKALLYELVVDISSLSDFDDVITFADIPVPKGVEIIGKEDTVVFSVQQPRVQTTQEQEDETQEEEVMPKTEHESQKENADTDMNEDA